MTTIGFSGDIGFLKYFKDAFLRDDLMSKEVVDFLADTDYTVLNVEGAVTRANSTAGKWIYTLIPGAKRGRKDNG